MSGLDFYGYGRIEPQAHVDTNPTSWEGYVGARVRLGADAAVILVVPPFLEKTFYGEIANTLASRMSATDSTHQMGVPEWIEGAELTRALAGARLESWAHRYQGTEVQMFIATVPEAQP